MIKGLFRPSKTGVVFGLKKYYKDKTIRTLYALCIGKGVFQLLILGHRAKLGEQIRGLILVGVIVPRLLAYNARGIWIRLDIGYRTLIDITKIWRYER